MIKCFAIMLLTILGLSKAAAAEVTADTTSVYIINGKICKNFTGKELKDKTIKGYQIVYCRNKGGDSVAAVHNITTTDMLVQAVIGQTEGQTERIDMSKVIYIIDGEISDSKSFLNIIPDKIKELTVMKANAPSTIEKFGESGKTNTFILITTKNKE